MHTFGDTGLSHTSAERRPAEVARAQVLPVAVDKINTNESSVLTRERVVSEWERHRHTALRQPASPDSPGPAALSQALKVALRSR